MILNSRTNAFKPAYITIEYYCNLKHAILCVHLLSVIASKDSHLGFEVTGGVGGRGTVECTTEGSGGNGPFLTRSEGAGGTK